MNWMRGMGALLAPKGSRGIRWDLEAGTAIPVRVIRLDVPSLRGKKEVLGIMVVRDDARRFASGDEIIWVDPDDLVPNEQDPMTRLALAAAKEVPPEAHIEDALFALEGGVKLEWVEGNRALRALARQRANGTEERADVEDP